jgi:hypothetical protein
MATTTTPLRDNHYADLRNLFNLFRIAQLNSAYHCVRLRRLERRDHALQALVTVATGASFGLLAFGEFSRIKLVAAILSFIAFLLSIAIPYIGLNRKAQEMRDRYLAWSDTVQQIEGAMRFVKSAGRAEGEIAGWVRSAEDSYKRAAALPTESADKRLVKKLEDQIRKTFPPDYVWGAL